MAQSWLVLGITDSALWVGVVAGASTVTVMALSQGPRRLRSWRSRSWQGPLQTGWTAQLLILTSRIAQAAVVFALAFLVTSGRIELWHIVVLCVVGGLSMAVMDPAAETLLMDIAGKERLLTASAVQSLVGSLSQFGAPAAAGVMIATVGVEAVFYSAGAVLVVASVLIATIRLPQVERPKAQPMLRALIDGLRYVAHPPPLDGRSQDNTADDHSRRDARQSNGGLHNGVVVRWPWLAAGRRDGRDYRQRCGAPKRLRGPSAENERV